MLRSAAFRFPFFLVLSFGFFYFSYKYYVPDFGGSDFYSYYPMYLDPFNYHAARSSFVYRQLTALIVHLVWKSGLFYDTAISFSKEGYDKHVFFAAILTNYVALTLSAVLASRATDRLVKEKSDAWPILAGMLCFFGFFVQQAVLTGLTEGISWLLVAIGFLAYVKKALIPLCVVLCLSVIQRETIPFVFGVFAAVGLVFGRNDRRFNTIVLVCSAAAFLAYVLMRSVLIPIPGAERQISPHAVLSSLDAWREQITRDFVFQALLSENLLILLALLLAPSAASRGAKGTVGLEWFPALEISLFVSACVLIVLGLGAGIGNNVGRILAVLTPIAAPLCVRLLARLSGEGLAEQSS